MSEKLGSIFEESSEEYKILSKSIIALEKFPKAKKTLFAKDKDIYELSTDGSMIEFYSSMDFYKEISGFVFGWWISNLRYIIQNSIDDYALLCQVKLSKK